jgi:hypothetical protein
MAAGSGGGSSKMKAWPTLLLFSSGEVIVCSDIGDGEVTKGSSSSVPGDASSEGDVGSAVLGEGCPRRVGGFLFCLILMRS